MSRAQLILVLLDVGRFDDAVRIIQEHPELERTSWTAQAQLGAGAYHEVMTYLPGLTASMLAEEIRLDHADLMIAWAMLLLADCDLVRREAAAQVMPPLHKWRLHAAAEILTNVSAHQHARTDTRVRARRVLDASDASDVHLPQAGALTTEHEPRLIELAHEMLTLRLT